MTCVVSHYIVHCTISNFIFVERHFIEGMRSSRCSCCDVFRSQNSPVHRLVTHTDIAYRTRGHVKIRASVKPLCYLTKYTAAKKLFVASFN